MCQQTQLHNGDNDPIPVPLEEQYYRWGTIWACYLWRLRDELGPDVADMLIAHSILFLSRWSGFLVGVCALIQADLLLFNGINQQKIIELSGLDNELRILPDEEFKHKAPDPLKSIRWPSKGSA